VIFVTSLSSILNERKKTMSDKMLAVFHETWPPELINALAWHEAGHAVIGMSYGADVQNSWIGHGRAKTPDNDKFPQNAAGGTTYSWKELGRGLLETLRGSTFAASAPLGAEALSPEFESFHELSVKKYHKYFCCDEDDEDVSFFCGTRNDISEAFQYNVPLYHSRLDDPMSACESFNRDYMLPVVSDTWRCREQIAIVVQLLKEKLHLTGDNIVAAIGRPNTAVIDNDVDGSNELRRKTAVNLAQIVLKTAPRFDNISMFDAAAYNAHVEPVHPKEHYDVMYKGHILHPLPHQTYKLLPMLPGAA
jgi:hypothetical protein